MDHKDLLGIRVVLDPLAKLEQMDRWGPWAHKVRRDHREKKEIRGSQDPKVKLGSQETLAGRVRRECRESLVVLDYLESKEKPVPLDTLAPVDHWVPVEQKAILVVLDLLDQLV